MDITEVVAPPPLEWRFSQVFGERAAGEEVQDVDIISAIEFDHTGEHLATGDRGGRVVLFERVDSREIRPRRELERADFPIQRQIDYRYSTEFQSHEPEFDYLKSLEIEEKINKIRWLNSHTGSLFVLSTNDKTVKLWKVSEKKAKHVSNFNCAKSSNSGNAGGLAPMVEDAPLPAMPVHVPGAQAINPKYLPKAPSQGTSGSIANFSHSVSAFNKFNDADFYFPPGGFSNLRLPTVVWSSDVSLVARCRRTFSNAHAYHINSISTNSDKETYISSDDLRINLWHYEINSQSFNLVDIKPANMEDLTEVITCAEFHPSLCNLLAYSSSKGTIRLLDLRQNALCDNHAKLFEEQEPAANRSFFSEIIASISDIKFARGGRYILSRDYMTLKLWDINMEAQPVATFKAHEYLRPKLCDLYENDCIFDKFECTLSGDGLRCATGSYSNIFRIFGMAPGSEEAQTLESTKTPNRRRNIPIPPKSGGGRAANLNRARGNRRESGDGSESPGSGSESGPANHDFASKLLHLAWHPNANLIACAASNSLYMYCA